MISNVTWCRTNWLLSWLGTKPIKDIHRIILIKRFILKTPFLWKGKIYYCKFTPPSSHRFKIDVHQKKPTSLLPLWLKATPSHNFLVPRLNETQSYALLRNKVKILFTKEKQIWHRYENNIEYIAAIPTSNSRCQKLMKDMLAKCQIFCTLSVQFVFTKFIEAKWVLTFHTWGKNKIKLHCFLKTFCYLWKFTNFLLTWFSFFRYHLRTKKSYFINIFRLHCYSVRENDCMIW